MTTIEDKISLFSKIIYDKVNEEKEAKLREFNEESERLVNEEKARIEELRKNLKREVIKKSNIKANELVAKEKLNKQREVLALKDNLVQATLDEVSKNLLSYVETKEYRNFFIKSLEKTLNEVEDGNYYVVIMKQDEDRFENDIDEIRRKNPNKKITIELSSEDFIGGIILRDIEGTFKVDNTLKSKLYGSREAIGIKVMEMLA